MFVPEWPSVGGDVPKEQPNNTVCYESSTDLFMNGNENYDDTSNGGNHHDPTSSETIELTHNHATTVTSVIEDEGDGMDQCAMWTATFPEQDEGDSSTATANATNHVFTSFGGGDIWSTEGFSFESPLKDLLDSNVYSLVDLLEQDELLQELRGCEARLIDYFSKPDIVAGLVECMICEVPYANEERGKERWCKEERERRAKFKLNEDEINTGSYNHDTTILDTSNEIEACWNSPLKNLHVGTIDSARNPEEEYDLRYCRYPYMACEVLCSDVGNTLNVLINGSVEDMTIDDDDDSLLNEDTGVGSQEKKSKEQVEVFNNNAPYLDESNDNVSPESNTEQPQQPDPPPTPKNKHAPNRRILDLLFSVLIDTPPFSLDDRRAGYFEKLLVILFRKYSQSMSDYMNTPMIVTAKSKGKSQTASISSSSTNNGEDESAFVSLMPSTDSAENGDASESVAKSMEGFISPINSELPISNTTSIHHPPMLMCALFDHLHSHSIMHIIQRLLLPSAARQSQNSKTVDNEMETDADNSNPNSTMNDKFMNAISNMNSVNDQNYSDDDDGLGDDDIDNPVDHLFQCDWSEHPTHGLELLLSRIEGPTEQPYLKKYNYPVGYDISLTIAENEAIEKNESALTSVQNASEILISIIQNSPLESSVMTTLSSDLFLCRIIGLASLSNNSQPLLPYESTMTCAMTVLENLILQFGGYGAEPSITPETNNSEAHLLSSSSPVKNTNVSFSLSELGPHTPVTSPASVDVTSTMATTAALIRHLPALLEELSSLLIHPDTQKWTTPAQYTHCEPRPILGIVRISIIRLIESLVLLGDPAIDLLLQRSDCLKNSLDLFWNFEWCSMLQQSVANSLVHIFEAGNNRAGLQNYFIVECKLLEKLMDAFSKCTCNKNTELNEEINTNAIGSAEFDNEIVAAMKSIYSNHVTSSVESLDGSGSDNSSRERLEDIDDSTAVAHVSEDDVESAMEKEEQDSRAMNADLISKYDTADKLVESELNVSTQSVQTLFRRGYMGHVIIICQAIANACNTSTKYKNKDEFTQERKDHIVLLNSSLPADFESSAVHLLSCEDSTHSKSRLDVAPVCIEGDATKVTISPTKSESIARTPPERQSNPDLKSLPYLAKLIGENALTKRWASFVSTTLASEIKVQSAPLGGQLAPKDSAASVDSGSQNQFITIINDDSDNDFLEDKGVFGIIDGDIDMNEAEIDIAAEMIESLTFSSTSKDSRPISRNRSVDEISLGNEGSSSSAQEKNIGNFGSLIQNSTIDSKGYVYDDPLGSVCQFNDDITYQDEIDITPEATDFLREEKDDHDKRGSNESDSTDEEDDDDGAPVLDLFTGNFAENFTNDSSLAEEEKDCDGDGIGWANFSNFDDAFAK